MSSDKPISDPDQMTLEEASDTAMRAGRLLQELATSFPHKMPDGVTRVRFPRGYIKTCDEHRSKLRFISDKTLLDNMADTMQMHDVFRWIFDQTDLGGPARLMLIKEAVFVVASLCEAIVLKQVKPLGNKASFKTSTKAMMEGGVISPALKSDLDRIWDIRNRAHLDVKSRFTHDDICEDDWMRSTRTFKALCRALS